MAARSRHGLEHHGDDEVLSSIRRRAARQPGRDPAARAEADTLRSQLAKAQIDGDLARYPKSATEAAAVADRAAAHSLRGVEAEAARIVADAKLASGDTAGARAAFDRAISSLANG